MDLDKECGKKTKEVDKTNKDEGQGWSQKEKEEGGKGPSKGGKLVRQRRSKGPKIAGKEVGGGSRILGTNCWTRDGVNRPIIMDTVGHWTAVYSNDYY